jgi:hypothetical protein
MWPLYGATAAAITAAVFRRWRAAALAVFVTTISALWVGFGVCARGAYLLAAAAVPAWVWSLAWVVVAIAASRSLWRARLLRTCPSVGMLAPAGGRCAVTAARAGARSWPRCAVLCGPVMVAMVAAHQLPLMIGGSAAVWWEQRHPRAWRDPVPVVILLVTAAVVLATSL